MNVHKWRTALVDHEGAQYFVRLPTMDAEEAKARIAARGWKFLRWRTQDEPKPDVINRLYPA